MISTEEKRAKWRQASLKRNSTPHRKEYLKAYRIRRKEVAPEIVKEQSRTQCRKNVEAKKQHKIALGGKCSVCGYDKCLGALHLHHTKNNKDREPSKILLHRRTFNGSDVMEVIRESCILLVCANCHAEIHEREGWNSRRIQC